jgi:hypothetical protein
MQITTTFNTGREYSPQGQIITVRQDIDNETFEQTGILFHDHTRGIWGQIDAVYSADNNLQSFVMRNYDAGNYSWHPEAGSLEMQEH